MKIDRIIVTLIAALIFLLSFFAPASSMDDPGFTINRMVVCGKIIDREPVAISETFSDATEKVYCFLEAGNIEQDTTVSFVWYYEKKEMARVSLVLEKGQRWRTYSSKKLAGLKGNWQVELQESSGIILNTISFSVE